MTTLDKATIEQWLDLDVDGELAVAEQRQLAEVLAADADLLQQQQQLRQLHQSLADDRITVRDGFEQQVMAALPVASWQRMASWWRLPLAIGLVLTLASVVLLSSLSATPMSGVGSAIFDFFASAALAGAGMSLAAWQGAGFGLESLVAESPFNLMALIGLVIGVNFAFFSLLRRRPARVLDSAESSDQVD